MGMNILDCETTETIYESIDAILHISKPELNEIFKGIDLEEHCMNNSNHCTEYPENVLFSIVAGKEVSVPVYDRVHWFHLTRTHDKSDYNRGILTLNKAIDSIWDFLFSLVEDHFSLNEWEHFKNNMGNGQWAHLYNLKAHCNSYGGPYAVLIREFAFMSNIVRNHDYLSTPEIVEDIGMCFQELNNFDLCQVYRENTVPCIVKFWHHKARADCVTTALYYLYNVFKNNEITSMSGTNFDGYGKAIPKENIVYIETPIINEHPN